jgi:leader peptidase (prepilin peptidase)/N-methyltransferase
MALLFLKFGATIDFIKYAVMTLFLIPISAIDLERRLILNKLTLPGFILGILLVAIFQFETLINGILGAVSGGGFLLIVGLLGQILLKKDSMGMGDVKLLVMIGIYVGFPDALLSLLFSMFAAAIYIFGGMALRKVKLGDTIPFGPFIAIGTLVFLLLGDFVVAWYLGLLGL